MAIKCGTEGEGCGGKFGAFEEVEIEDENVDVSDDSIGVKFTAMAICGEGHQFARLEVEEYHLIEEGDPCPTDPDSSQSSPHQWEIDSCDIECSFENQRGRKVMVGSADIEYSCPTCGRSHSITVELGPLRISEFEGLL